MYLRLYREKVLRGQADKLSPFFGLYDLPFWYGMKHGFRCQVRLSAQDTQFLRTTIFKQGEAKRNAR